jgi:hypothetical protein
MRILSANPDAAIHPDIFHQSHVLQWLTDRFFFKITPMMRLYGSLRPTVD